MSDEQIHSETSLLNQKSNQIDHEESLKNNSKPVWIRLLVYFGLTYLITWTCWIVAMIYLNKNDYPIPSNLTFFSRMAANEIPSNQRWLNFLFSLGTYGPMLAAICVHLIYSKDLDFKTFLKSFIKFKLPGRWYLIIIVIPVVETIIYMIMFFLSPISSGSVFQTDYPWYYIFLLFLNQTFSSGLEEPGWRGFATPEMQKVKNAEDSGFIIGIFWAIWHFPFLIVFSLIPFKVRCRYAAGIGQNVGDNCNAIFS